MFKNLEMKNPKTVLIDTNILFPAFYTPKGWMNAFIKSELLPNFNVITTKYILTELDDILRDHLRHKKYRKAKKLLEKDFISLVNVIDTPEEISQKETLIADIKDHPILRTALAANAILLTEDRDFLRERDKIEEIEILKVDEFRKKYLS